MKRRFNFTERKRINKNNIIIQIKQDADGTHFFEALIDLSDLMLPDDASVYVEAYHRTGYMRFDFGKVSSLRQPSSTSLSNFGDVENVLFRIKIVDESGSRGKIIAVADKIKPVSENGDKDGSKSILPTQFVGDLGRKIWQLDYTMGRPCIMFNRNVPDIENRSKKDSEFFFFVYPSVVREVLNYLVYVEQVSDPDDPPEEWHKDWIMFTKQYVTDTPESLDPEEIEPGELNDWIESVVNEFCNSRPELWENIINKE